MRPPSSNVYVSRNGCLLMMICTKCLNAVINDTGALLAIILCTYLACSITVDEKALKRNMKHNLIA